MNKINTRRIKLGKVGFYFLCFLFQSRSFLALIIFITLSLGNEEARKSCNYLSTKTDVCRKPRRRPKGKTVRNVILRSNYELRIQRSPEGQRWQVFTTWAIFPHQVSWQTLLIEYPTIRIETIHNLWMLQLPIPIVQLGNLLKTNLLASFIWGNSRHTQLIWEGSYSAKKSETEDIYFSGAPLLLQTPQKSIGLV